MGAIAGGVDNRDRNSIKPYPARISATSQESSGNRKPPPLFKERQLCPHPEPVTAIERPGEPPPPAPRADATQPTAKTAAPKLPHIWEVRQFMSFYGQFMGFYRLIWGNYGLL
jgi:hypothetical protein